MVVDLNELFGLTGKIAVITGAAGALCGEMSESLSSCGVRTVLLDIDDTTGEKRAAAIRKSGNEALFYKCNVLDEERLRDILKDVSNIWGVPDFLINGAGGNQSSGSTIQSFLSREKLSDKTEATFFDMKLGNIQSIMDINFYGTFLSSIVFGKGMTEKGKGVIVNISSMAGISPLTRVGAYSAAKAGVINFTKWLGVYLSHTGVRVNTIAPGFIMTEQSRFLQFDKKTGEMNERGRAIVNGTPMGRYGESDELIGTLIWLLSDASSFVTGAVVPVDGGFSSYSL